MQLNFLLQQAKNWIAVGGCVLLFLVGLAAGIKYKNTVQTEKTEAAPLEMRLSGYRFINPLLDCEIARNPVEFRELRPFQDKIEHLIQARTAKYKLAFVSVYFRDLMNGPWFGINENALFTPASLLKVPIMIACLKQAEQNPAFLAKRVRNNLPEDWNQKQLIKPLNPLISGKSYTVEQLIRHMIEYSDNNAAHLLSSVVDKNILLNTFKDLGVRRPVLNTQYNFMSAKMYASFLRILYNASYLSRWHSQKALEYLSFTSFKDGLVAGVPSYVLVAHKFGEYAEPNPNGVKQLHNCGIIYYPNNPYLLCIMSRGMDFSTLDDIIHDISEAVYQEVNKAHNPSEEKTR